MSTDTIECPPVPEQLTLVSEEDLAAILEQNPGQAFMLAGLSLVGEEGYFDYAVGLIKVDPESESLKSWSFHAGHPEERFQGLHFIDSFVDKEMVEGIAIPNTICYLMGTIPDDLVRRDPDMAAIRDMVQYALGFISDELPVHDWKRGASIIANEPDWEGRTELFGEVVTPHTCWAVVHGQNPGCICDLIGTEVTIEGPFEHATLVVSYVTSGKKTIQEREFSRLTKQ